MFSSRTFGVDVKTNKLFGMIRISFIYPEFLPGNIS